MMNVWRIKHIPTGLFYKPSSALIPYYTFDVVENDVWVTYPWE